jgi:peroxiredoxin
VKRWIIATAFLLIAAAAAPPRVGDVAPDFRLFDQNDHLVRLSAERGHKVVLVFYRGYW